MRQWKYTIGVVLLKRNVGLLKEMGVVNENKQK